MGRTYAWLAVIIVLVVTAHLLWGDQVALVRDYGPGVASEVLGILITLIFVQRILERRQQEERARASRGGVRRAEDPLRDLASLWAEIVKGCLEHLPARPPKTYQELFASEWSASVDHCDTTQVRYAWSDETWAESAARIIARARDQISAILDLYGVHLNAHFIEALDEVRDDPFLAHVETLGEQLRVGRELYPDEIERDDFVLSRTAAVRGKFLRTLVRAINLYNEAGVGGAPIAELPEGLWSPEHAPRPGELRVDREPRARRGPPAFSLPDTPRRDVMAIDEGAPEGGAAEPPHGDMAAPDPEG